MEAMNSKFESKFGALRAEFDALHSKVRANQQALMAALQNAVLRGEMGTQREISELRERVLKINFVLSGNDHTSIQNSRATKR